MADPTSLPVPSNQPSDLEFNAKALDKMVNSPGLTFQDRLGITRDTWAGVVAKLNADATILQARQWATKTDGPVADGDYSAKYHAWAAAVSDESAAGHEAGAATQAGIATAAATAAMSTINIQPSKATGLGAVAEEGVFTVLAGGADGLTRTTTFVKRSGVAVEVLQPVSGSEFDAQRAVLRPAASETPYWQNIIDADGYIGGGLSEGIFDGITMLIAQGGLFGLTTGLAQLDDDGYWVEALGADGTLYAGRAALYSSVDGVITGLGLIDDSGYWVESVSADGTVVVPTQTTDSAVYGARNDANLAASAAMRSSVETESTPICTSPTVLAYSILLHYGQSLGLGLEGYPAGSKVQPYNNVMIGGSPYQAGAGSDTFTPNGGSSAFQPLIELRYGLTDAQVAALPPGTQTYGETMCAGMANGLKKLHNNLRGYFDDPNLAFVGHTAAVGSKTVAQLSKGATPNLFQAMTQAMTAAKANADAASKPIALGAWVWAQGENDYGSGTTKASYKSAWITLAADIQSDIATGIFGQTRPVPKFIFDTSANSRTASTAATANSIDMALLELSNEQPSTFHVGGTYHVPDKGVHLTGNGYRWRANLLAKVAYRVLYQRWKWKPLQPRGGSVSGNKVAIDFLVPVAPLAFGLPYIGRTATDFADKGFTVVDSLGTVAIQSVRIVFDTIVELTLAGTPFGETWVRYADVSHTGSGCLRDSDDFVSPDAYFYTAGSGQYADENIPALVGKPYPNQNWCVPFNLQVQ